MSICYMRIQGYNKILGTKYLLEKQLYECFQINCAYGEIIPQAG